jgi:hypothetical protein
MIYIVQKEGGDREAKQITINKPIEQKSRDGELCFFKNTILLILIIVRDTYCLKNKVAILIICNLVPLITYKKIFNPFSNLALNERITINLSRREAYGTKR